MQVTEPSVFTFWAKSAVDIEQRTIRLKSNSHTTSAILDTITAACVQVCSSVLFENARLFFTLQQTHFMLVLQNKQQDSCLFLAFL
jgi:hypothetical protein